MRINKDKRVLIKKQLSAYNAEELGDISDYMQHRINGLDAKEQADLRWLWSHLGEIRLLLTLNRITVPESLTSAL